MIRPRQALVWFHVMGDGSASVDGLHRLAVFAISGVTVALVPVIFLRLVRAAALISARGSREQEGGLLCLTRFPSLAETAVASNDRGPYRRTTQPTSYPNRAPDEAGHEQASDEHQGNDNTDPGHPTRADDYGNDKRRQSGTYLLAHRCAFLAHGRSCLLRPRLLATAPVPALLLATGGPVTFRVLPVHRTVHLSGGRCPPLKQTKDERPLVGHSVQVAAGRHDVVDFHRIDGWRFVDSAQQLLGCRRIR
jgi:hypothetical protein